MKRTVLICDDEPAVRFAIEEALEVLGVETIAADDGEAALARVGEADVVLTDLVAEGLAEAELFGHEKGAFTGAVSSRAGYFRQANGGTLVLDEIGELPLAVQGKLLRALQEQEVHPLGAQRVEKVDVRVVACTHRDLRAEVQAGRFREDLFYRVAVVEIVVPPLRERTSDIPLLVEAFRKKWAARFDLEGVRLSPALVAALTARPWPGNVRELENAIARLLALAEPGDELGPELVDRLENSAPKSGASGTLREQMAAFEAELVARARSRRRTTTSRRRHAAWASRA